MADLNSTSILAASATPRPTYTFSYSTTRISNAQVRYHFKVTGTMPWSSSYIGSGGTNGAHIFHITLNGVTTDVTFKVSTTTWSGTTPKSVEFDVYVDIGASSDLTCTLSMTSGYFTAGTFGATTATVSVPGLLSAKSTITGSYFNYQMGSNEAIGFGITENTSGIDYTYSLKFKVNGTEYASSTPSKSSTSITPSAANKTSMYAGLLDNYEYSAELVLETFFQGSSQGTISLAGKLTIPSSNAPTFNGFSYVDTNAATKAITALDTDIIQGQSTIRVTITAATLKNNATLKKYTVIINGRTYTSTSTTIDIGTMDTAGNIRVIVEDSRGLTAEQSIAVTPIPYNKIIFQTLTADRQNGVGDQTTLNGTFTYTPLSNANDIITLKYKYKLSSDISWPVNWTTISLAAPSPITKNGINCTLTKLLGSFSIDLSYNIKVYIADNLTSVEKDIMLTTAAPLLSYRKSKLGINKIPGTYATDEANGFGAVAFDVRGAIYSNGAAVCPVGSSMDWSSDKIPTGWAKEDGTAYNKDTYPELFLILGTKYGSGNGTTTHFAVPNSKGRATIATGQGETYANGSSTTGTNFGLGDAGGKEQHILAKTELPTGITGSLTMHGAESSTNLYSASGVFSSGGQSPRYGNTGTGVAGVESIGTLNFSLGGSGFSHNNLQPYIAKHKIIRMF